MVLLGLQGREEAVHGRLLLRNHRRTCRCNADFGIHSALGICHHRSDRRCGVQLRYQACVLPCVLFSCQTDLPAVKFYLRIDDALDLGAEHAMGGIIGLFFNGLFADKNLVALDGVSSVSGGWLNHNYKQLYIQFAYICAAVGYAFVVTALLAKTLDMIPYMRLRASPEDEALGMDDTQVSLLVRMLQRPAELMCAADRRVRLRLRRSAPRLPRLDAGVPPPRCHWEERGLRIRHEHAHRCGRPPRPA